MVVIVIIIILLVMMMRSPTVTVTVTVTVTDWRRSVASSWPPSGWTVIIRHVQFQWQPWYKKVLKYLFVYRTQHSSIEHVQCWMFNVLRVVTTTKWDIFGWWLMIWFDDWFIRFIHSFSIHVRFGKEVVFSFPQSSILCHFTITVRLPNFASFEPVCHQPFFVRGSSCLTELP